MNHSQFRQYFYQSLTQYYSQSELMEIYHWCVEELHGWNRSTAYAHNTQLLSETEMNAWKKVIERLKTHEPVQYIFEHAYFRNLELKVTPATLIPRPETEELVQLVLDFETEENLRVMDIGSGSGCIPLSLKQERPSWNVSGMDISEDALAIAIQNANAMNLDIRFTLFDALQPDAVLPACDVVVSNPPYIPQHLLENMDENVKKHEPYLALFVPDEKPFLFFEAITQGAIKAGARSVYFETHATEMTELKTALSAIWKGKIASHFDLSGKERFLRLS
jgi:release factor glutamine methyltransferase